MLIFKDIDFDSEQTFLFKPNNNIPYCLKNPFTSTPLPGHYIEKTMTFQAALNAVINYQTGHTPCLSRPKA